MIERSKSGFRALREMVGITQGELASAIGMAEATVRHCESQPMTQYVNAPEKAWDYLNKCRETQKEAVNASTEIVEDTEGELGEPKTVMLTYFYNQEAYDTYGRDKGTYTQVNATTREVAKKLDELGYNVKFVYAGDSDHVFSQNKELIG